MNVLLVALGGALGSVLRHLISAMFIAKGFATFWPTLFVNVLGSFLIGIAASTRIAGPGDVTRYFFMVGVLGGFTTFSTFSLQTLELFQKGNVPLALGNIGLSLLLCLAGVWLGHLLGQRFAN
jgi:fluoride exporter